VSGGVLPLVWSLGSEADGSPTVTLTPITPAAPAPGETA
jgi:hypothetical protein